MANKYIKDLTLNTTPSLTGHTIFDNGTTTYKASLDTLKHVLVESGSHHITGSQHISGSLSVTGAFTVSGAGSVKEFLFVSGFQVIGTPTHHVWGDPEVLHVGSINSYNIAHFNANHDHYSQINVKNVNSGSSASGDIVITADNGSEDNFYLNMGINSSTYDAGDVGYENDGYIINRGSDLYIGSQGAVDGHNNVHIFSKGNWQTPAISVLDGNVVGFNTLTVSEGYRYEFSGNTKFDNNVVTNGFTVLSNVTSSFNNDTEAAVAGVPLHGLYRSGSHILIRLV